MAINTMGLLYSSLSPTALCSPAHIHQTRNVFDMWCENNSIDGNENLFQDACARNIPVVKAHLFFPLNVLCLPVFTTKVQQGAGFSTSALPLFHPQQVSSKTCKEGLIWTRSFTVQQ